MQPANPPARLIAAQPLARADFLPYGDLVCAGEQPGTPINAGSAQRFDDLTRLDFDDGGGAACLAIFRTGAAMDAGALALHAFERHCLGSQTFVPLGAGRCLCIVAGGGDAPNEAAIRAFIVEPGQGVTLRRGVWHHPLITLGAADVLVIERRAAHVDCDIHPITSRIMVTVDGIPGGSNHETR